MCAAFRRLTVLLGAFEALTESAPGFAGGQLTYFLARSASAWLSLQ